MVSAIFVKTCRCRTAKSLGMYDRHLPYKNTENTEYGIQKRRMRKESANQKQLTYHYPRRFDKTSPLT